MKSVKSRDVQYIFEKHVGPIEKCVLTDCVASIQFTMPDHARTAVERYDGGILEISTDKKRSDDTLISLAVSPWAHDGLALRSKLEEPMPQPVFLGICLAYLVFRYIEISLYIDTYVHIYTYTHVHTHTCK
ncbi:unnamed protein product [Symbiodinium sp. CCMP2456]|nr:unnamed protein product [Symbiodinium sp. CCMP2456]